MTALHLDVRGRPPPEPMERILDALEVLPPGWHLVALTPLRPLPLLPMLDADGFAWRLRDLEHGGAVLTVCHAHERHLLETTGDG